MNSNKMIFEFDKMQAQGNSYVYFDMRETGLPDISISKMAQKVSNKNIGIGSDGIVLLLPDNETDVLMRMFNADGSESQICGSALQSIIALLARKTDKEQTSFTINTKAGSVTGLYSEVNDEPFIKIDYSPILANYQVGNLVGDLKTLNHWTGIPVSVGNPHFVLFEQDQKNSNEAFCLNLIEFVGPIINYDGFFPNGVNVEMVKINNRKQVSARVWERGSGETLSCGTGAIAITLAGNKLSYLDNEVEVIFLGGSKIVEIDPIAQRYYLSGNVRTICTGTYEYLID